MSRRISFASILGIMMFSTFLISPCVSRSCSSTISSGGKIVYVNRGLNYLSLYHEYSRENTPDSVLRRDFSRFIMDGINAISLSLYWYRLEGDTRGDYDGSRPGLGPFGDRFLDNVKRVCRIANEYGLRVILTIHTLWNKEDGAWSTPAYVFDPVDHVIQQLAIVRSEDMKQAFLDMFAHVVQYMADTPVYAWALLNEPWHWPHVLPPPFEDIDQKENFIDIMQKQSAIVKRYTDCLTTVRFVCVHEWSYEGRRYLKNIFDDDWNWDQRIFSALDFISFNIYLPSANYLLDEWRSIVAFNVIETKNHNKLVWNTEFGVDSDDDAVQRDKTKFYMDYMKTLPVQCIMGWFWRGDSPLENPGLPGKGMNYCADALSGEGRPAYLELAKTGP